MRRFGWLVPIAIAFVCIGAANPAKAGGEPPACDDPAVLAASIEAVENFYYGLDMSGGGIEKTVIKSLQTELMGDTEEARRFEQWVAPRLGLKRSQVRVCHSPTVIEGEDYRPQVIIAMNPNNPNDWGLIVQNLMVMNLQAVWGWLAG